MKFLVAIITPVSANNVRLFCWCQSQRRVLVTSSCCFVRDSVISDVLLLRFAYSFMLLVKSVRARMAVRYGTVR